MVAIGGTNGKSTTTALVRAMLAARADEGVRGRQPRHAALARGRREPYDVLVLEVSSFQLERVPTFHPQVAALLNVTEDHLDRYPTFAAYAAAKGNMFVNQTRRRHRRSIPAGDALVHARGCSRHGRVVTFGPGGDVDRRRAGEISHRPTARRSLSARRASASAARTTGTTSAPRSPVPPRRAPCRKRSARAREVRRARRTARRSCRRVDGVRYYDDSKGTNVGASVTALRGLARAAGGAHRGRPRQGRSYGPLVECSRRGSRGSC